MTRPDRKLVRRGSTRTIGLAASIITALLFVALVGFFYLKGKSGAPVVAKGQSAPGEAPPDIRSAVPGQAIGAGKGMEITLVDKRDPSRIALRILSQSSEPQENARYQVQKPQAFVYSRNGVVWHIRADKGLLYIPNTQMQPEAATLEGNVLVRAFDEPPKGEKLDPEDPALTPLATFTTNSVQYDGTIGEVTTEDPFHVTTDQADFTATGLRGLFNQEKNRLEYLEIQRDQHLRYRTDGQDRLASKKKQKKAPPPPTGAQPPAPAAPKSPPIESFYVASLTGGVVVTRGAQSIHADALDSWLHMLDNELSDNAITPAPVRLSNSPAPTTPPTTTPTAATDPNLPAAPDSPSTGLDALAAASSSGDAATAPAPPTDPASQAPASKTAAAPQNSDPDADVIDMRWPGSMVIRIAETRPPELAKDEVAVRFTTGPDSLCRFRDDAARSHGTASTIEYGATSQVLKMASVKPDGVLLTAEGSGNAVASSLAINLGSGVTTIHGPGSLRDQSDRYITWDQSAEFQFHVGDEGMTSLIETASASGDVQAMQGTSGLRGQELTAGFLIDPAGKKSSVFKLVLRGEARAVDGRGSELAADTMDVAFSEEGAASNPAPLALDARGNVLGMSNGTSLSSDLLHVDLETDGDGQPTATRMHASGNAKFTKAEEESDGDFNVINAQADEIQAQVDAQLVELTGPNSSIGNLTTKVSGSTIRIDGLRRYVDVFGVGRFEHRGTSVDSDLASDATVTWNRHVSYDDLLGIVECEGNVVASNQPDSHRLQTLRSDRVRLILEPLPQGVAASPDAPGRQLKQAYAWGIGGDAPRPAQLEMRIYDSPFGAGRERPSRVAFLEGATIIADDEAGTLSVPGTGRMFFSDRRRNEDVRVTDAARAQADAAQTSNPFGGKFNRGDTRFAWRDSMLVDNRMGTITIVGKSNLRHVRLSDGLPTDIESDTLIGRFRNMQVSQAERQDMELRAEFLGADADGNVWIRSTDNKELVADRVEYDAESGIAKAIANEGNTVVFFDPSQGVPQRARVLFWDQANNRIEVRDAGTIVVPR